MSRASENTAGGCTDGLAGRRAGGRAPVVIFSSRDHTREPHAGLTVWANLTFLYFAVFEKPGASPTQYKHKVMPLIALLAQD